MPDPFEDLRTAIVKVYLPPLQRLVQRLANLLCRCGWHAWESGHCLNCGRHR